ncbi:MAG TPA: penicillin-binding protein 2 [Candidatus Hydrogenedentes bacterium]|nr:penicillin-binding protein 2 [Candidatus Hydrogenedentota bacterium]HQH52387.1 penicillin-binding protein 2 [Candidatus Hydrogenedentota bacterium]
MLLEREKPKRFEGAPQRLRVIMAGIVVLYSLLALRLWDLQIIHGNEYAEASNENRLHFERLEAPRGIIYGRSEDVVLADTQPACDIMFVPADCRESERERVARRLAQLLAIDANALIDNISKYQKKPFTQLPVKQNVSKTELARVEEYSFQLPGVYTTVRPLRRYHYGEVAGQVLGYVGEISQEELNARGPAFRMGDLIGRMGVEQMYDPILRGRDGQLCVVVYNQSEPQLRTDEYGRPIVQTDSLGRRLHQEFEFSRDPVPGKPLTLTIDIGLQAKCEELLGTERGAIVVLAADTGEVLAIASTPRYDPGVFVRTGYGRERTALLEARPSPMRNRAFQERYAPGSIFKVAMAIGGLEEGVITEHSRFGCDGYFRLPGVSRAWKCWRYKYGGHGHPEIIDALAYSCDEYFYNVGLKLGIDNINKWAEMLGLGIVTGLDVPPGSEEKGLIPSTEWKREQNAGADDPWEQKWYPGETVNVAIGQGQVTVTPLQAAVMMAAVINGGNRVRPYLNKSLGPDLTPLPISGKTLEIVTQGLRKCVEKTQRPSAGTGIEARIPGMVVLGKTGTAQVVRFKHYDDEMLIPYDERDHAWFVAGVPGEEPPIAVCVLIEHGLHGSSAAAPLTKQVIEYFYSHLPKDLRLASAGEDGP